MPSLRYNIPFEFLLTILTFQLAVPSLGISKSLILMHPNARFRAPSMIMNGNRDCLPREGAAAPLLIPLLPCQSSSAGCPFALHSICSFTSPVPCCLLPSVVGVLSVLVSLESDSSSSEDLALKCRRALKSIIAKLTHLPALDALVHMNMAEAIMKIVLEQVRRHISDTHYLPKKHGRC